MKKASKKFTLVFLLVFLSCISVFGQISNDKNKVKYRITAVKNGDNSIVSESNIVEVNIPLSIYIPNAFTPNGDGLNDGFKISGEGIEEFEMSIYNKWGEMIFETAKIDDEWDGTFGGEIVAGGIYVYEIRLKTSGKKFLQKSGNIMVIK